MKILFLHGWNSVPGGLKPTFLKDHGHNLINPQLDDEDFATAVAAAQSEFDRHQPQVVVGSSRGGAVAMNINSDSVPLVLLCPAWKNWGTSDSVKPGTRILHSRADDVIPFADSLELCSRSGLSKSALIEVGNDHRLAAAEPLRRMLEACEQSADRLVGCDFGVPKRAGDQARKNILIEATFLGDKHYAIRPWGRNDRLLRWLAGERKWPHGRPGWTLPQLAQTLLQSPAVRTAAMDFPFGVPLSLLEDANFSSAMGQSPFLSRDAWIAFVNARLRLEFSSDKATGEMLDLRRFEAWRDQQFWKKRASDVAAGGQPPLKHVGQNLFAMTLGGACLLQRLADRGFTVVLGTIPNWQPSDAKRTVFETYPRRVAARAGFSKGYKAHPQQCLEAAERFLEVQGIRLDFDGQVKRFCETYGTGARQRDPDGADAFLCLVAAICFNEGNRELIRGDAGKHQLQQEGGMIVPEQLA